MKILPHIKNAIRYEWFNVLFDRFYSYEHCGSLPLNDIHQDIARRITFGWGFAISFGINTLLWIFLIFRLIGDGLPWIIASVAGILLLSLVGGAVIGTGYLGITLFRIAKKELELAEAERLEKLGEKHENG